MKMTEVCRVFESAGMQNVSSVLASGNILFESEKTQDELKELLEKTMSEAFDYEAFLFIRNKKEINSILENLPLQKDENHHLYVFVANPGTEKILEEEFLKAKKAETETAAVAENVFYWKTPKGNTLESEFGKILGRKNMKDRFTSRNINTFEKIAAKLDK